MRRAHLERHTVGRLGWLRAAVLGADDGLLSTASLIIGVASSAHASRASILVAGAAGLFAGALSMAAGEYVSVSSQRDAEHADVRREAKELAADPAAEEAELCGIYVRRGLSEDLARQVARQLMAHGALEAHKRDELGLADETRARPFQAAGASALSFSVGAMAPLGVAAVVDGALRGPAVAISTLVFLAILGGLGARAGGARLLPAVTRVTVWGAIAMGVTAGLGHAFGALV